MTREEAVKEIEKAFEPAFANYIITALTEGATASDKEQETCEDAVSRDDVVRIVKHNNPPKALEKIRKLSSVTPQEQFKPMVEIDLYSVIKQSYIEREVLDEIRAEIEEQVLESLSDGGDDWFTAEKVNECLDIIDKYKAESEET